jgi:hypothetical protein
MLLGTCEGRSRAPRSVARTSNAATVSTLEAVPAMTAVGQLQPRDYVFPARSVVLAS